MKARAIEIIIKNIYKDEEIREVSITLRSGKEIIFCPEENETNFMTIYNEERNATEKANILVLEGNQTRYIDCDEIIMIDY